MHLRFLIAALFAMPMVIHAQLREIYPLKTWSFSRDSVTWQTVSVPHDWAIAGPFDKKWDMQMVAIEQNGEKEKTEKTAAEKRAETVAARKAEEAKAAEAESKKEDGKADVEDKGETKTVEEATVDAVVAGEGEENRDDPIKAKNEGRAYRTN